MDWYVRAARQGHQISQLKLAELLLSGTAIEPDYPDAYFWLLVAARDGSKDSIEESKKIRQFISASDAERIQLDAISWQPKPEISLLAPNPSTVHSSPLPRQHDANLHKQQQQIKPKKIQLKISQRVDINPFDELKIRELIRHSSFLKKPAQSLADLNELFKWTRRKDAFESAFLARYCDVPFDTSDQLSEEMQRKLDAWVSFSKRRGL